MEDRTGKPTQVDRLESLEKSYLELKSGMSTISDQVKEVLDNWNAVQNYFGSVKKLIIKLVATVGSIGVVCAGILAIVNLYHVITVGVPLVPPH